MILTLGLEEIKGFSKVSVTDRCRIDEVRFTMQLVPQVHVELLDFASKGAFELQIGLFLLITQLGHEIAIV